jgi:hypothetical protein
MALVGWVAGCVAIWSALFTVGNLLYGRVSTAMVLLVVFVVSGAILIRIVSTLWTESSAREADARSALITPSQNR